MMKKAIITLMIALTASLSAWAGTPDKVEKLIRQYKGQDGFEVVTLGRAGLGLLRSAAVLAGDLDKEDRAALNAFKGIRKLYLVDFEDAPSSVKEHFTSQLERALGGMELILESKDSTETMRIYGIEDGARIRDCIIYSSEGDLLYAVGSIDMGSIGELEKMQK